MKLLIAEDDVLFVKLLDQILSPRYELVVARDGNEAWATLQQADAPRLAILDWVMPGLTGPEICRRVRASRSGSSMYLIIFTAKNNAADITAGLRSGADDYLTKPPVPEELRARVALGERVLALQDQVDAQSVLVGRAVEREIRLRERLTACPSCAQPHRLEDLHSATAYLGFHPERAASHFDARPEIHVGHGPSISTLEPTHS